LTSPFACAKKDHPCESGTEGFAMIVIEKRKAARAAYWAVLAYFSLTILGPLLADFIPGEIAAGDARVSWMAETLRSGVNEYVLAGVLAALVGYAWPRELGYPTRDGVERACLLGLVLGVVFIGLTHYIQADIGFISGFKFGFVSGVVTQPAGDAS
jgi:hypothetical protein